MWKYIIAALLVVLAWAMVLVLQQPIAIAVYVTAAVAFLLVAWIVYRKLWARRSASRLEKGLSAQADKFAEGMRPEELARIQAMKTEFQRALQSLKSSKAGGGGAAALYALPWYMIIGPPGAGKTTAIGNSGLRFPGSKKLKGVGGTRNCDWWFANEAVILDTAGRYTTEEDDRDEWLGFLDLLRKSRPKRPLNGILVAISASDIAGVDEDEVGDLGTRLKERIDEVTERLQMIFPVYILVTKCDLLPGFSDVFGDLSPNARGQAWGFTVEQSELAANNPGDLFFERFTELQAILERRAIHRLARERRQAPRERIFQFPQQFSTLQTNLRSMIERLFAPNLYQEPPLLRGVYFTSGTQEGRPIDRIKHEVARSLGVEPRLPREDDEKVEPKSYFMRDVFFRVIFPDQNLAVRTKEESRRQARRLIALAGGSVALAALLASIPIYAGSKQRELVRGMRLVVESIRDRPADGGFPFEELAELRARMPGLCGSEGGAGAWFPVDSPLYVRACELYMHLFRAEILEPLVREGRGEMNDTLDAVRRKEADDRGLTGEEYEKLCRALKLHLLLTEGPDGEPKLETGGEEARGWVGRQMIALWKRKPGARGVADEAKQENIDFYMSLFDLEKRPPIELKEVRGKKLVDEVREALARTSVPQLLLDQIVADVAEKYEGRDLTLADILDEKAAPFGTETVVKRAYTREAWEKYVRKRVASSLEDCEPWVIAEGGESAWDPKKQMEELQKLYFEKYVAAWRNLLENVTFQPPSSEQAMRKMIVDLTTGPVTPLHQLMKTVAKNAELELLPPEKSAAEKVGEQVVNRFATKAKAKLKQKAGVTIPEEEEGEEEAPAKEYVKPVRAELLPFARFGVSIDAVSASGEEGPRAPLDTYIDDLSRLRSEYDAKVIDKPEEAGQFVAAAEDSLERTRDLIRRRGGSWTNVLEQLLVPPVRMLEATARGVKVGGDTNIWCSRVTEPFRSLRDYFPFNPSSPTDAALDRFTEFFRPKTGLLWSYYAEQLAGEVAQTGAKYEFRGDGRNNYNPQLLQFLAKAQDVTRLMFVGDSPKVTLQATLHLVPGVEYVKLEVSGQKIEHRGGKEIPKTIEWPGKGETWAASIHARGRDKNGRVQQWERSEPSGEWAFFRLLGSGTVKRISARDVEVSWPMESFGNELISVDLKFTSDSPIFGLGERGPTNQFMNPFVSVAKSFPLAAGKGAKPCPR